MAGATVGLFLGGRFGPTKGRETIEVRDPSNRSLVGRAVSASAEEARAAMEAAARAQPEWEAVGGSARAKVLVRAAELLRSEQEEIARLVTREMGKVLYESRLEMTGAIDNLEYYALFGRTFSGEEVSFLPRGESQRLLWLPRGVVVALTPWNFPAATVTRKIGPALLAGNALVLKPSSATPLTALRIADAFRRAGLPPGVLSVLPGSSKEIGAPLIQHPQCSTVTLTGSTETGAEVLRLAAPGIVKCLLELGGKAPVIVASDADLDWAVKATAWARYWNAGQACIAAERTYVHEKVAPDFQRKLAALVRGLRMGPGLSRGVDVGPLYSEGARDGVAERVEEAVGSGARPLVGGKLPTSGRLAQGAFYPPTILTEVPDDSKVVTEEVFGPVLPLLSFEDVDDVIARANASKYGLSSYVFTRNASLAERMARELRFGETYVNRVGPENAQGFHTGFRQSGLGGEGTRWGVMDYLQLKTVYVDWREPHQADYFLPYRD